MVSRRNFIKAAAAGTLVSATGLEAAVAAGSVKACDTEVGVVLTPEFMQQAGLTVPDMKAETKVDQIGRVGQSNIFFFRVWPFKVPGLKEVPGAMISGEGMKYAPHPRILGVKECDDGKVVARLRVFGGPVRITEVRVNDNYLAGKYWTTSYRTFEGV